MIKGTIVFVHGAWHGKWCWDKYFRNEFIDNGYEVISFNLPGHDRKGKIRGINRYSIRDYVNSLANEVSRLDRPPILIGHSMGGLIVQKYLEDQICEKAVLLASVPPYGVINAALKFARKSYFYSTLLDFNMYGLVDTKEKCRSAFFSDRISEEELTAYTLNMCSESIKAFVQMMLPRIRKTKNSTIPMLVVGGKMDSIFTVEDNIKTAKKYDADLIIIDGVAHDMMLDVNHKKVSVEIIRWLDGEVAHETE